jgi:PmbA protein
LNKFADRGENVTTFSFDDTQLHKLAAQALAEAETAGASSAAVNISESMGQTVTVRLNEVETIAYNRDHGLSITAYIGQKKGSASTSDMSKTGIQDTAAAAVAIAKYTASDPYAGLADPALFARQFLDLDLYHPADMPVEQAIDMAKAMEYSGMAIDKRINNSGGASVTSQQGQEIYANSLGFAGIERESYYSASVALIAKEKDALQQDYWVDATRVLANLFSMESIGQKAGERALRRLNARRLKTRRAPVLFEAPVAGSLINHWIAAVSGTPLYRGASFLVDSLETPVFSSLLHIQELPHVPQGFASRVFDAEGVATHARDIVTEGILHGYFLSTYSARKLAMQTTGNAGGPHNLYVKATHPDLTALVKDMQTGLLVTELMGQGINMVTGDYSRGASGFWVENGEIQYPVEEITIAGNLKEMFRAIVGVGADSLRYASKQCGSILIDNMMIAGA